ncbi:hypothetical protein ACFWD7_38695 [Streptomyces mirabilis]|nr:hypothetical protein [Streptomyces mirabilis]MCT9108105.1 hypothetical protein [Streptomyces mirabilis]
MNEEEMARAVARGLAQHEARRANAQTRQLLGCLLMFAVLVVGFI